ncbi:hypothetical protein [uncultured Nocardioides sp.]|uniref:hypothetical protein n=1 Tax=uncultured Nocardioides sp. TaxID=198441 RepID=UPI00262B1FB5|nr:hypothetical protein [uncultured Nocardioides sp.]
MGRTVGTLFALLIVAGCTSNSDNPAGSDQAAAGSPSPTQPSEPSESANEEVARGESQFSSVEELRDAAVDAGYTCKRWRQTDDVQLASESGSCSGKDVFAVFADEADKDEQIRLMQDFMRDYGFKPDPIVSGGNWTINAPEARYLSIALAADLE